MPAPSAKLAAVAEIRRPRGGYYPGDWVRPRPNPGGWTPIADTQEIHTGNRSTNRAGAFELYDAPVGVRLRVEQAAKSAPLVLEGGSGSDHMKPVRAWREDGALYALYDANGSILLARSEDGQRWRLVERVTERGGDRLKAVFEDPTAPPEGRFKGMGCDGGWFDPDTGERMDTGGEKGANEEAVRRWKAQEYQGPAYHGPRVELGGEVIGWTSPDRRRWRTLDAPLAPFPMDGGLSAGYDRATGHYFAYCRVHGMEIEPGAAPGVGSGSAEVGLVRRAIGLTRTRDFRSWPPPKLILAPDGQDGLDVSFYGCDYFPYPAFPNGVRDDLHGMLIQVYHQATDHVDSQIAFSRDGLFWHRPERRPIIPLGAPGEGDSGMVYSWGCGVIELPDGSWGSLYAGSSWVHNAGRPGGSPARGAALGDVAPAPPVRGGGAGRGPLHDPDRVPHARRAAPQLPLPAGRLGLGRAAARGAVARPLRRGAGLRLHLRRLRPAHRRCRGRRGDLERPQRRLAGRGDGRHPAAPVPGHGVRLRGVGFPCTMTTCTR